MNEPLEDFRDLVAWRRAMDLVELVYAHTEVWTADEPAGIKPQVRSAVVSVPALIAKGHATFSPRDFARQLRNAQVALTEAESLVRFGARSNPSSESELDSISKSADRTRRRIGHLLSSLDLSVPN